MSIDLADAIYKFPLTSKCECLLAKIIPHFSREKMDTYFLKGKDIYYYRGHEL